jgi:hypothetical protein
MHCKLFPKLGVRTPSSRTSLVHDTSLRAEPPTSGQLPKGFQNYAALPQQPIHWAVVQWIPNFDLPKVPVHSGVAHWISKIALRLLQEPIHWAVAQWISNIVLPQKPIHWAVAYWIGKNSELAKPN